MQASSGLTQDELLALGLEAAQAQEALQTVRGLSRQGLTSADQAAHLLSQVNMVMGNLRAKRFGFEDSIGRMSDMLHSATSTNADRARALAGGLARRLAGNSPAQAEPGEALAERIRNALTPPNGKLAAITQVQSCRSMVKRMLAWSENCSVFAASCRHCRGDRTRPSNRESKMTSRARSPRWTRTS